MIIDEDQPYTGRLINGVDDGESTTITPLSMPPFLLWQRDGDLVNFGGTPLASHVGSHTVSIRITDAVGLASTREFPLEVRFVDDLPTTVGIPTGFADEDSGRQQKSLLPYFNDEEDGALGLTYSLVAGSALDNAATLANASIDGHNLSFDLVADAYGSAGFLVRGTDFAGQAIDSEFRFDVAPVDDQPQVSSIDSIDAGAGAPASQIPLAPFFSDADPGDSLSYSLTGNTNTVIFASIRIDPLTGELALAYAPYVGGEATVTVRATDRNGL